MTNEEYWEIPEEELFSKEYLAHYRNGEEIPPEMNYLDNGDCVILNAECSLEITVTKPTTEEEKKYCRSIINNLDGFVREKLEEITEGLSLSKWELGWVSLKMELFAWKGEISRQMIDTCICKYTVKPILYS